MKWPLLHPNRNAVHITGMSCSTVHRQLKTPADNQTVLQTRSQQTQVPFPCSSSIHRLATQQKSRPFSPLHRQHPTAKKKKRKTPHLASAGCASHSWAWQFEVCRVIFWPHSDLGWSAGDLQGLCSPGRVSAQMGAAG